MVLSFRILILWLHVLAAMVWLGGLAFQWLVVTPGLKRMTSIAEQVRLGLGLEIRCRLVIWPAIGLVLFTGLVNVLNVLYATVMAGGSVPRGFIQVLGVKILGVVGMVVLQAVQQLALQPRRLALLQDMTGDRQELPIPLVRLQRQTRLCQGLMLSLAVGVVLLALLLRG